MSRNRVQGLPYHEQNTTKQGVPQFMLTQAPWLSSWVASSLQKLAITLSVVLKKPTWPETETGLSSNHVGTVDTFGCNLVSYFETEAYSKYMPGFPIQRN